MKPLITTFCKDETRCTVLWYSQEYAVLGAGEPHCSTQGQLPPGDKLSAPAGCRSSSLDPIRLKSVGILGSLKLESWDAELRSGCRRKYIYFICREEQEWAVRKMIFLFVLFHVSHLPKVVRSLSQSLTDQWDLDLPLLINEEHCLPCLLDRTDKNAHITVVEA